MGFDRPRGGGKGEHVINGGGDLEGALVAVALHAGNPFGIHHARTHDAAHLFFQGADHGALGARMVIMIDAGLRAGGSFYGCRHAAFELIVIVTVQNVVFTVVLIVDDGLNVLKTLGELDLVLDAGFARAVGEGAPGDISSREVSSL